MRHRRALLLQGLKRQEDGDIDVFFDCLPRRARELRAAAWLLRLLDGGRPLRKVDQDRAFLQSLIKVLRRSRSVYLKGDRIHASVIVDEMDR
jgi:hypothetical protein